MPHLVSWTMKMRNLMLLVLISALMMMVLVVSASPAAAAAVDRNHYHHHSAVRGETHRHRRRRQLEQKTVAKAIKDPMEKFKKVPTMPGVGDGGGVKKGIATKMLVAFKKTPGE